MSRIASREIVGQRTKQQRERDDAFKKLALRQIEDTGENWALHCLPILKRNSLARLIYLNDLYQRILPVPGVICEFGVQWGATLSTLLNLRALYEPYNHSRMVYGFDTFNGLSGTSDIDGNSVKDGDYAAAHSYEGTLQSILQYHESICPFPEKRKFELVVGDVRETVDSWLEENSHAIIALAIFDMDIYEPTKIVLERIQHRLVKGSILVFDEANAPDFPGETLAVQHVLGLKNIRLTRHPLQSCCAIYEVD